MFSEIFQKTTNGILVEVRSFYLKERSTPHLNQFAFAYQVRISNQSQESITLLRRYWRITDGSGQRREVVGDGVIGEQPTILPGESHDYISGCEFNTPIGQMHGFYTMVKSDGSEFRVRIPKFILTSPSLLNWYAYRNRSKQVSGWIALREYPFEIKK